MNGCNTDPAFNVSGTPMQITWPWPPVGRFSCNLIRSEDKNGNVNIKLWDLCETLIVYILLSTFQWALTVNWPDVRRYIASIDPAYSIPWEI